MNDREKFGNQPFSRPTGGADFSEGGRKKNAPPVETNADDASQNQSLHTRLPRIGITMGDAAGIGPEITLKALAGDEIKNICQPVIIGAANFLQRTAQDLGLDTDFFIVKKGEEIPDE